MGPIEGLILESEEEEEVVGISEEERRDGDDDDDVVIEIREEGYELRMDGESSPVEGMALSSVKRSLLPSSSVNV